MGHGEGDEKKSDEARGGVTEVAGATPENVGEDGGGEQESEWRTGAQNLQSEFAIDSADGEGAPGGSPEGGVEESAIKDVVVEKINGEEKECGEEEGGNPDSDGGTAADGSEIKQKCEREGDNDDHGKLRADGDGERDGEQDDATPIPEDDFARGVKGVGDGDGGEDGAEGSPGGEDFGLGVPDGAGLNHRGRKTVESESEKAALVAAEAAGDIPKRCAEEQAAEKKRKSRKPAPVGRRFLREQALRPGEERRGGDDGEQRRVLGVEVVGVGRDFEREGGRRIGIGGSGDGAAVELTPSGGDADLLGGFGGEGGMNFGVDEPESLEEEGEKESSGEELRASETFAGEECGHEFDDKGRTKCFTMSERVCGGSSGREFFQRQIRR
jgi:hypothetical protein